MTALSALAPATATGLVRQDNEDAAYGGHWLFAIADGLSGHTAGMGTTLTAMLFSGGRAALAHIGDSRAFRLRGGQLRQITEDHTIGNLVADVGLLALVLATAPGRQAGPFGRYGPAGPAGR